MGANIKIRASIPLKREKGAHQVRGTIKRATSVPNSSSEARVFLVFLFSLPFFRLVPSQLRSAWQGCGGIAADDDLAVLVDGGELAIDEAIARFLAFGGDRGAAGEHVVGPEPRCKADAQPS